jgi:DNA-binding CsgD family transcriptional regulator
MSKGRARQSKAAELARLRAEIAELLLSGMSIRRIAGATGRSPSTVAYHIRLLKKQWEAKASGDYEQWVAVQLQKVDFIESQAWLGWEGSKLRHTTTVRMLGRARRPTRRGRRSRPDEESWVEVSRVERVEETPGDAAFLQIVLRCIKQKAQLVGLYAHTPAETQSQAEPDPHIYEGVRARLIERLMLVANDG